MPTAFLEFYYKALGRPRWFFGGTALLSPSGDVRHAMTIADYLRVVSNLARFGGNPGYHLNLYKHGFPLFRGGLELALTYGPSVYDILALVQQHGKYRPGYHDFRIGRDIDGFCYFEIVDLIEFGDAASPIVETPMLKIVGMFTRVLGGNIQPARVSFRHEEPLYAQRLRELIGCDVTFTADRNAICFPTEWLQIRNIGSDPELWRLAQARCVSESRESHQRDELRRLNVEIEKLLLIEGRPPRLKEVADRLDISERTLIRRLRRLNLTYQSLTDDIQKERALELFAHPGASVAAVSERLGFSDPSGFRRTFRRWYGMNPSTALKTKT
ncbi:helix-turn-helix domain-containing protein [Sphingosinicella microcystinivorans]|nr:helix-turn-helix domain-containing protein [Sphingosinicella microcystinivorans]RKS91386.1 AraC-like DNA-binding protein [Sphingosinicella microcystinivorans]